jgi:hypothetical protein
VTVELKQHYVAFLDILGFSDMVKSDIASEDQPNLTKLFACHQSAAQLFKDDPTCVITQFSDSIVISRPYNPNAFGKFVKGVAKYQRLLLDKSLLCRGGIAVNKHFSNGSFTFSAGVIEAYRLESESARYPRVVISPDLIDLLFVDNPIPTGLLAKGDDGLFFVDYLHVTKSIRPVLLKKTLSGLVSKLVASKISSLREKGIWQASYSDFALNTTLSIPKFSRNSTKV